jgi:CYTH domain-containing protein
MGVEIERKFLVADDGWRAAADAGTALRQGYLAARPDGTVVRIRMAGSRGFITIKGPGLLQRAEYEYPIPAADAVAMLDTLCTTPLVEKRRHAVHHGGLVWTVDVFGGHLAGLTLAEVELADAHTQPVLPSWVGAEVTHDPRYANAALARATAIPAAAA